MNEMFQEKRVAFFILLGLLIALLVAIYFLFLRPIAQDVIAKETEAADLETKNNELTVQIEELEEKEEDPDTFMLQKQVPATKAVDELLLKLEEAENLTPSRIENVKFDYQEFTKERFEFFGEEEDEEEKTEAAEELGIDTEDEDYLKGMHIITVDMDVLSPNYASFNRFLLEVETWERIVTVASLDFVQPAEEELVLNEDPDYTIVHKLQLVTYYYEEPKPEDEEADEQKAIKAKSNNEEKDKEENEDSEENGNKDKEENE